jgi:DDE_Tnp_1-associated
MEQFTACVSDLDDPREDNARHDLHEIVVTALGAMPCGAGDCSDRALFGRAKEAFLRRLV